MNPVLPLNEYIPDIEPHIFNGRVYLYGSHDRFMGKAYCEEDYVLYSCDPYDLTNWKYEGIIYKKTQDPNNKDGKRNLFAPDVVKGNDGYYYLYYGLDGIDEISVAKSDKPEGPFEFYGHLRYPKGISKNSLEEYPANFDPAVINDNGHIYCAFGFSIETLIESMHLNEKNTHGAYIVELEDDMLTMKHAPKLVIPGWDKANGTDFDGHSFLEASSLRKYDDVYYFIYSSLNQHELCYATSDSIYGPYQYQGVLVSNAGKLHENEPYLNNWANNHGSLLKIDDDYYMFYHRHTNATQYSRQVCVEHIVKEGKLFKSALMTSSGLNDLETGTYDAGIACFVYEEKGQFIGFEPVSQPWSRIEERIIKDVLDTTIVYRYFKGISKVTFCFNEEVSGMLTLKINDRLKKMDVSKICTVSFEKEAHVSLECHFELDHKADLIYIEVE